MSRSRLSFLIVSGVVVLSILSGALLGAPAADDDSKDSLYKYLSVFTEVLRLVREAYVDDTELRTLMAGALEGASDALDPFSMYIPAAASERYKGVREVGALHSGVNVVKVRGAAYLIAVQEGSPGAAAGLRRGDIITELGGLSTRGMPLWQIQQQLAAPPGSTVELEILHGGETSHVEITLDTFDLPSVRLEEVSGKSLLRIPRFDEGSVEDVRTLVSGLTAGELLVDLRGVADGDAEAAYEVARIFAEGELGALVGREGDTMKSFSGDAASWSGRLVVLIDRGSQGAAEVLARVLQEAAGAKLVGQRSFGFAGHSELMELDAGGALLITDGFYTGPDLEPLNEGIQPDVRVSERSRAFGQRDEEIDDLILDRAIELLEEGDEALEEAA